MSNLTPSTNEVKTEGATEEEGKEIITKKLTLKGE
jgi:hypothetical protein